MRLKPKNILEKFQELTLGLHAQSSKERLTLYIQEQCKKIFNVEYVAVFYISERWEELTGIRPEGSEPISFPRGEGIAGMVAEQGECLLVERCSKSSIYSESIDGVENGEVKGILSVPLLTMKNNIEGVVQLINKKKGRFKSTDEDILMMFGRQVAEVLKTCYRVAEQERFIDTFVKTIAGSVDAKYAGTVGRSQRVIDYALSLASAAHVLESKFESIELAVYLHNLGRLAYNWEIHRYDRAETRKNLLFTEAIIKQIDFPSWLSDVPFIVLSCREHVDGSGLPKGLLQQDIPLGARIIAICDFFDRLFISGRLDGSRYTMDEILDQLRLRAGKEFDPDLVNIFIEHKVYEREKRQHKRVEFTGELEVTVLQKDGSSDYSFDTAIFNSQLRYDSTILDVSSGGISFRFSESIPVNTLIILRIPLAVGKMKALARVSRVIPEGSGIFKIGAYFIWQSGKK